jgi:hypothetical protein
VGEVLGCRFGNEDSDSAELAFAVPYAGSSSR